MLERHTYNTGTSGYLLEASKILMNDADDVPIRSKSQTETDVTSLHR